MKSINAIDRKPSLLQNTMIAKVRIQVSRHALFAGQFGNLV